MKSIVRSILVLAAGFAVAACSQKEIEAPVNPQPGKDIVRVITAYSDNNITSKTKTALNNVSVEWSVGDKITLFSGNTAYTSNALTSSDLEGDKAQFTFPGLANDATISGGVYPEGVSTKDGSTITIDFPSAQIATANSFAPKANVAVAEIPGAGETLSDVKFYNIGGLLSLTVSGDKVAEVASIRLSAGEGTALSGKVTTTGVSEKNVTISKVDGKGKNYVELVGSFTSGSTYYFTVLPGTYGSTSVDAEKLRITFTSTTGATIEYKNPNVLTVKRNDNIFIADLDIDRKDWVSNVNPDAGKYVLCTTAGAFVDGGKYIIGIQDGANASVYRFLRQNSTNIGTGGSSIVISENKISNPDASYVWTATANNAGTAFSFSNKPSSTTYYVNNGGGNTTLSTTSTTSTLWYPTFDSETKTYKLSQGSATGRYIGTNSAVSGGSFKFAAYLNKDFVNQISRASAIAQYSGALSIFKLVEAEPTYSVTYDANTGSGDVPMDSRVYFSGSSALVLGNVGNTPLTKIGYTFNGWNTAANGSGTSYQPGDFLPIASSDITLYAQWQVKSFQISYSTVRSQAAGAGSASDDASAGSIVVKNGANDVSEGSYVNYGTSLSIVCTPNRGYSYRNWQYKEGEGNWSTRTADLTYTMPESDVQFRATFNKLTEHHVSIANNITGCESITAKHGDDVLTAESVVYAGETITIIATAASGYGFASWNLPGSVTDADASSAETTFTMPDADIVLNATFGAIYNITLDGNGGTISASPSSAAAGATITLSVVTAPNGKELDSWSVLNSDDTDAGVTFDPENSNKFEMPAKNVKVKANWKDAATGYRKVTTEPANWSGEYLIVYETSATAGLSWNGLDAGQNGASQTISSGTIAIDSQVYVTIAKHATEDTYSIMVNGGTNNGKYVSISSYSNGLKFADSPVYFDFAMNNGAVEISKTFSGGTMYLLYNKVTGVDNERFRFYKGTNLNGSNYATPFLYKK